MNSPYDLVGPVLPQALRLARYQASANLPENVSDLQSENDTINQTPSREEERLLVSNANIMTALENLFSRRQKDRTCRTSKLTRAESIRFQRAMYRIWLISVLFGPRRSTPTPESYSQEHFANRNSHLKKSWKDQKFFLEQFSTPELFQINLLALHLVLTAQWAVTAEGSSLSGTVYTYDWNGMFLFAGPHAVLRCYEEAKMNALPTEFIDDDGPYEKFLQKSMSEILEERQVRPPIGPIGVILDDINGEYDRCRHCQCGGAAIEDAFLPQMRLPPNLYNETNWDDLRGQLAWRDFVSPNLSRNPVEKPLIQALKGDWSRLLHEMFICKTDPYAQWSRQDWICGMCWFAFFRDTIWRWRLLKKKRAGEHIAKDCRCGYDCNEQCFEKGLAHAQKFNHLCKPTDGSVKQYS